MTCLDTLLHYLSLEAFNPDLLALFGHFSAKVSVLSYLFCPESEYRVNSGMRLGASVVGKTSYPPARHC